MPHQLVGDVALEQNLGIHGERLTLASQQASVAHSS